MEATAWTQQAVGRRLEIRISSTKSRSFSRGVKEASASGAIRFSLPRDNSDEDIDHVVGVLPEIVARLRSIA